MDSSIIAQIWRNKHWDNFAVLFTEKMFWNHEINEIQTLSQNPLSN